MLWLRGVLPLRGRLGLESDGPGRGGHFFQVFLDGSRVSSCIPGSSPMAVSARSLLSRTRMGTRRKMRLLAPGCLVWFGSFLDVWTACTVVFVGFWERDGMEEGKLFLVTMAAAASSGAGAPSVPADMVTFCMYSWTVLGCRLAFRVIPLSSGGPPW